MADKTSATDVLRRPTSIPTWLLLVLVIGPSAFTSLAQSALGDDGPESAPVVDVLAVADVHRNSADIDTMQNGIRTMRENQLLICAALDVDCER